MKACTSRKAFSLFEVVTAIAILGVVGTLVLHSLAGSGQGADNLKLDNDVRTLNAAVNAYLTFGGNLDSANTAAAVLAKLKTRASDLSATQTAGLTSSVIDPRIDIQMQNTGEASSADPRVVWNAGARVFEITHTGGAGIKKFVMNESLAGVAATQENRDPSMKLAAADNWIWDYNEAAPAARPGPTLVATTVLPPVTPVTPGGPDPDPDPDPTSPLPDRLAPPLFSILPGTFPIAEFESESLTLTLSDTNPAGVSHIIYSLDFENWRVYRGQPIVLTPGVAVSAYAASASTDYIDSDRASEQYQASAVPLQAPVVLPSAPEFDGEANQTVSVVLDHSNDPEISSIQYRVNSGPWTDYSAPFTLNYAQYPDDAIIDAKVISSSEYYEDSPLGHGEVLMPEPETLQAPIIALSSNTFNDDVGTIEVSLSNPNAPIPSTIHVAVTGPDGSFPPVQTWGIYTGPFNISSSYYPTGFAVRAYAKSGNTVFWLDSPFVDNMASVEDFFGLDIDEHVLFVIDATGSMKDEFQDTGLTRFEVVKQELIETISSLTAETKFNVVFFGGSVHWSDGSNTLIAATIENRLAMIAQIEQVGHSASGTDYEVAMSIPASYGVDLTQVVFLTDGQPDSATNWQDDVENLTSRNIRVDSIGVGMDEPALENLTYIAEHTNGRVIDVADKKKKDKKEG